MNIKQSLSMVLALVAGLTWVQGQSSFIVSLDSGNEVPANSSPARGVGTFTLNTDGTLSYNINYIGLTGDFAGGQLETPGGPGGGAPVVFPLSNLAYTARAGKLTGITTALTAAQKSDLTTGQTYANILTASLPGGEIRGAVNPAQIGPFNAEDWPPPKDPNKRVHYLSTDHAFTPPSDNWVADELIILTGGDQVTQRLSIGGHT